MIGQILLNALGITLPSFRIAGGVVLLVISMKMILGDEPEEEPANRREGGPASGGQDVSVFPLAMPFIAGPGTIMAAILLTDNDRFSIPEQAVTTGVLLIILAFTCEILARGREGPYARGRPRLRKNRKWRGLLAEKRILIRNLQGRVAPWRDLAGGDTK